MNRILADVWAPDSIAAIVSARHGDPFSVLGMHPHGQRALVIVRVFLPGAKSVTVIDKSNDAAVMELHPYDEPGCFASVMGRRRKPFAYRLRVEYPAATLDIEDPYAYGPALDAQDIYLFAEGTHQRCWRWLGAHERTVDQVSGVQFVVWAPAASRVAVVGDFNHWDGRVHGMRLHPGSGLWELFIPGVQAGAHYKYEIRAADGRSLPLKADPFARGLTRYNDTASRVMADSAHSWNDHDWMSRRRDAQPHQQALSIYEVHPGSWRRHADGSYLSYGELADQLIPYCQQKAFSHIQLMPISEFPFDGSWGYQPVGLFAPTCRFGTPDEFRLFVDRCHQAGIGVLLDWVPGHFPTDEHGLGRFDGTALYEHEDPRKGYHQDWNTLIYNYGRNEVRSFLLSNACFWLEEFHIDGLRVDAVASMLYLDYSRKDGEWIPNEHGGNENLEAISLLRLVNERVYADYPGIMMIAEESTAWPGVSRPTSHGGLGFGFKWNMGWMHDTLQYMAKESVHRRYHHDQMTFGLVYAFSENFVLPLSHDEVVHGKGSLLGRMPGDDWQRFANLRAYFGFMWTHPGKKLLFMGGEFAQQGEWSHDRALDWWLLDDARHQGVSRLIDDLNRLYRELPALHRLDCAAEGFCWLEGGDADNSVFAFSRMDEGNGLAVVVVNMTPVPRPGYRIGVTRSGYYRERLNTDSALYGGSNLGNGGGCHSEAIAAHGQAQSLCVDLPPLATLVFECLP